MAVLEQIVWVGPALDVVGKSSRTIATVDIDAGHTPLLIVQRNTFTPTPNAVIPLFGKVGEVIVPAPDIKVQLPVPTAGVLPFNVATVAQIVWFAPAFDMVGFASRVIATVDVDGGQLPLLIVH